jgi:hypothetical protein
MEGRIWRQWKLAMEEEEESRMASYRATEVREERNGNSRSRSSSP